MDAETIKKLRGLIQDLVYAELDDALSCTNGGAPSSDRQRELEDDRSKARKAVHDHLSDIEAALSTQSSRTEAMRKALEPFADIANLIEAETEGLMEDDTCDLMFHDYLMDRFTVHQFSEARAALLSTPNPGDADGWKATHRHKKRGSTYSLIGIGKMQTDSWEVKEYCAADEPVAGTSVDMEEVAIYRSTDDGSLWVRPREEFEDGRFEVLSAPPTSSLREGEGA